MVMLKRYLFFLLLSFAINVHAQSFVITYDTRYNKTNYKNELILNDSISTWTEIPQDDNDLFLKDLFLVKKKESSSIYFSDLAINKLFFIRDTLHNMKWELNAKTDTILSYHCNAATTSFRGRNYDAYYSVDIPYSDGPWKFGGLPGVILNIKSEDGLYEFSAFKIEKEVNKKVNNFDVNKFKFITWRDFEKQFITTVDNLIKKIKSTVDSRDKGYIKLDAPEIIYSKAQTGEGIEY